MSGTENENPCPSCPVMVKCSTFCKPFWKFYFPKTDCDKFINNGKQSFHYIAVTYEDLHNYSTRFANIVNQLGHAPEDIEKLKFRVDNKSGITVSSRTVWDNKSMRRVNIKNGKPLPNKRIFSI